MVDDGAQLFEVVEATQDYAPDPEKIGNQAFSLGDFLTVDRPKLTYHIERHLPEAGKMTISAMAKGFKTTLLQELGLCAASGDVEYLNFSFNEPVNVLMAQPELSDALMDERSRWIAKTAPPWLNRERAYKNFHILETTFGRPALWPEHPRAKKSRAELERELERKQIRLLLIDSLYMTMAGMDENAADEMTRALDYLGDLANRFGVAIILTHHFGKSGTIARGSSVYQGWGETDLSISGVENDSTVVRVDALMRCAFPRGYPAYWRKPNEETAWFEMMPEGWEPERKGRKPQHSPAVVAVVLQAKGSLRWGELRTEVMTAAGCSQRTAETLISDATADGVIMKIGANYMPAAGGGK